MTNRYDARYFCQAYPGICVCIVCTWIYECMLVCMYIQSSDMVSMRTYVCSKLGKNADSWVCDFWSPYWFSPIDWRQRTLSGVQSHKYKDEMDRDRASGAVHRDAQAWKKEGRGVRDMRDPWQWKYTSTTVQSSTKRMRGVLCVSSVRLGSTRFVSSRFSRIRYDDIVIQYPPVVLGAFCVSRLGLVSLLRRKKWERGKGGEGKRDRVISNSAHPSWRKKTEKGNETRWSRDAVRFDSLRYFISRSLGSGTS